MGSYDIGDKPRLSAVFTLLSGTPADPSTVICRIKQPDGTLQVLQYGVDSALVKDSVGHYHVDVQIGASGIWRYRWEGSGDLFTSEESSLTVRTSKFE